MKIILSKNVVIKNVWLQKFHVKTAQTSIN